MADAPVTSVVRRINELPPETAPSATDVVAIDGLATRKATLSAIVNAGRPFATDAEADSGNSATKGMSPSLVTRTIEAKRPAGAFGLKLLLSATASAARTLLELGGLATKTTVNNSDWSGADLSIENGGTGASTASAARGALGLGSAATTDAAAYATAAQGGKADTAVQPGSLATVATSGAYGNLSGRPTLGTAAAQNTADFATAAQGDRADSALVPSNAGVNGQVLSKVAGVAAWTNANAGDVVAANNLSDVASAPAAVLNLGAAAYTDVNFAGRGGTTDHGFDTGISRKDQSATGEQGSNNKFSYHRLLIDDTASQRAGLNGASGSKVDGLEVFQRFGGSSAHGGRHAVDGVVFQDKGATAAGNVDRFYVGVVGQAITPTGDGGTGSSDTRGSYFGINGVTTILDTASPWIDNVTSGEWNTFLYGVGKTNMVRYHSGLQVASWMDYRGYEVDAAVAISALGGAVGFKHGFLFGSMNGRNPFDADSTLLAFKNAISMTAGIDLRNGGFSLAPFLAQNMQLGGNGLVMSVAGAGIELGSLTASGNPFLDFHSSGLSNDYDVRLSAVAGSATAGQGGFLVRAAYLNFDNGGEIRVSGNKVVGARQSALADTDATPSNISATLNALLLRLRIHGLIAT